MNSPDQTWALTGLHLLLTNTCNYECDHCFVWGSPRQTGTMTLAQIQSILDQGEEAGVRSICFEGGEPFLYYPILVRAATLAHEMGFRVSIVSNQYWATAEEDARLWLRPFVGIVDSLSISADDFHGDDPVAVQARYAHRAALTVGMAVDTFVCERPQQARVSTDRERGAPVEGGAIVFKGRAAVKLTDGVPRHPWRQFDECPHERLDDPGRVHVDPAGNLHVCQGLSMGNLFERPLVDILAAYRPAEDPVFGPLLSGGPAALVEHHGLPHREAYADACHLCYEARTALRPRYPGTLGPGGMYGEGLGD